MTKAMVSYPDAGGLGGHQPDLGRGQDVVTAARIPSPEATGGAGPGFEVRTFAVALARLLRGDRILGLDAAPTRVRLQQRVADAVLDDVVLECADRRGGIQSIEYQVKRRLRPTEGDSEFV